MALRLGSNTATQTERRPRFSGQVLGRAGDLLWCRGHSDFNCKDSGMGNGKYFFNPEWQNHDEMTDTIGLGRLLS